MYRLIKFADQSLEFFNQVDDIGSGDTPVAFSPLPEGGALDLFAGAQKHPSTVERVITRRIQAASEAELQTYFLKLIALRGRRDRLYRRMANGEVHWIWARLVAVNAKRDYQQTRFKRIQDIELRFVTQEATWHGDIRGSWYLNDGHYFNDGLFFNSGLIFPLTNSTTTFTISVGASDDAGRAPVLAMQIIVRAGSADISSVSIYKTLGGETIFFNGSIQANSELRIDTGALRVLNDGDDAYNAAHIYYSPERFAWFSLWPGENQITVERTDGDANAEIEFLFYEAWY